MTPAPRPASRRRAGTYAAAPGSFTAGGGDASRPARLRSLSLGLLALLLIL